MAVIDYKALLKDGIELLKAKSSLREDDAAQAVGSPPVPQAPAQAPGAPQQAPTAPTAAPPQLTVDTIISKLNTLRRGRSLNDEPLYSSLEQFFNALPEQDKSTLDRLLSQLDQIILSNLGAPGILQQTTPGMPPAAPGMPVQAPATVPPPQMDEQLNEAAQKDGKVVICGGKEVDFASSEHVSDLHRTIEGIEVMKNHFSRGSITRHLLSSLCSRLKRFAMRLSPQEVK